MIDNRYKHYYSLVLARTTQLRRYRGHVIIYRLGGEGGSRGFWFCHNEIYLIPP